MAAPSFRLHTAFAPLPEPPTARAAAARALALLGDGGADGARIFDDRPLTEALDPLRLHPALGVRCGSCDHGIAFIALAQQGAYLVSANRRQPPKRRHGGVWDLADITTPPGPTRAFPRLSPVGSRMHRPTSARCGPPANAPRCSPE